MDRDRGLARERGVTVLLCTHLLMEVEELCTRVLILNRGRVVADGTVAEIVRRAAAPRSARLRVPVDRAEEAIGVVSAAKGVESVDRSGDASGSLTLVVAEQNGRAAELALAESLRALVDARIPLLSFEVEGARLSDAFLAVTEER